MNIEPIASRSARTARQSQGGDFFRHLIRRSQKGMRTCAIILRSEEGTSPRVDVAADMTGSAAGRCRPVSPAFAIAPTYLAEHAMSQQLPHYYASLPELSQTTEIRYAEAVIGILITENAGIGNRPRYRFKALDRRFQLLDDSRFFAVQKAAAAVDRISRLATCPVVANQH